MEKLKSCVNFVRRHKGKIAAGVTVAGAIYVARRYLFKVLPLQSAPESVSSEQNDRRSANFTLLTNHGRIHRGKIFACLLDRINLLLETKYRLTRDELMAKLNAATTLDAKVSLWKEVRTVAFSEVFSFLYLYSAAALYSTAIVAEIYLKTSPSEGWPGDMYDKFSEEFSDLLTLIVENVESLVPSFTAELSLKQGIDCARLVALARDFDLAIRKRLEQPSENSCVLYDSLVILKPIFCTRPFLIAALSVWEQTLVLFSQKVYSVELHNKAEPLVKLLPILLKHVDDVTLKRSLNSFSADILKCDELDNLFLWSIDETVNNKRQL